jgi:uncharacterized GH25 family protein
MFVVTLSHPDTTRELQKPARYSRIQSFSMKKFILLFAAYLLFSSHDMFLKMGTYFLQPNTPATIKVFNGTFDKSENVIARKRMRDVSLIGNGARANPDTTQWTEIDSTITVLNFKTGAAGTWVAGLSSLSNKIELKAKDFNEYLEHDGVTDEMEWRKNNNALGKDAVEKYSKHVKAIFQVGDTKTDDWKTLLGYPIEFVPERNPYDVKPGESLNVKLLWNNQPLPNQLVYIGSDGGHDAGHGHAHEGEKAHAHETEYAHEGGKAHAHKDGKEHSHEAEKAQAEEAHSHGAEQLRTDANGVVSLNLAHEGVWYLRTIHMAHSTEAGFTHESNWATLTFEVGQGHSHEDGQGHSHGLPTYVYWIAGLALLGGLYFFFRRKK